jgi:hypothetical protein
MDIYSILSSKTHNPHYLNRYITFIEHCQQKNVGYEGYVEKHHICPKAGDMFPEYTCFKTNPWNCAVLTARQHLIAHLILCKVYDEIFSVVEAYWHMSNYSGNKINSKLFEYLRIIRSIRISEKLSGKPRRHDITTIEKFRDSLKGKVFVVNESGKIIQISNKDDRFVSGKYKHYLKDMINVKDKNGKIYWTNKTDIEYVSGELKHVFDGLISVKDVNENYYKIEPNDPRYLSGEFVGVCSKTAMVKDESGKSFRISVDHEDYTSGKYKTIKENFATAKDRHGNSFWAEKNDPRFLTGEIVGVMKDTVTVKDKYGNKLRVSIDDPRYLSGDLVGVSKGGKWYNNGVMGKVFMENETIPDGFIPGMLKKNKNLLPYH